MLIATESCSVLNLFYRQIIHRKFAVPKGGFFHLSIPYFLGKKNKFRLIFTCNVCFVHGNLVHFLKDYWDFSNNFSLAFAVDLLVYYLHGEVFLPLENTGFGWVFFYWSAFPLSGLLYHGISWWSVSSPPTPEKILLLSDSHCTVGIEFGFFSQVRFLSKIEYFLKLSQGFCPRPILNRRGNAFSSFFLFFFRNIFPCLFFEWN